MIDACPEPAVLFFDVDGTLTSFDPDDMTDKDFSAVRPSQAVIEAFHTLRDAGHKAFICTGRPLWLIADSLRELDPEGIVAMAGATLEVEGRVVHEDCFDEDIVEELARRVADAGIEALFEANAATFSMEPAGVERPFLIGTHVVHSVEEMRVDGRLRVGKVCLNAPSLARVANDDGFIERNFELCNTGGENRELSPKGIDKGVGVARALEYLGRTDNARTFGFGDSGNDLGMLAAVETAVAMGNAMPEVKALADYVTDDV
ncbi:MAG: HAD-IIB family hydrolase, partial [Collinsella sp.]